MNNYAIAVVIWLVVGYIAVVVNAYVVGRYERSNPSFRPKDFGACLLGPIFLLIRIVDLAGYIGKSHRS